MTFMATLKTIIEAACLAIVAVLLTLIALHFVATLLLDCLRSLRYSITGKRRQEEEEGCYRC